MGHEVSGLNLKHRRKVSRYFVPSTSFCLDSAEMDRDGFPTHYIHAANVCSCCDEAQDWKEAVKIGQNQSKCLGNSL